MSIRTDLQYARKYEEDKQWYASFTTNQKEPTSMQHYTISQIEKRSNVKFEGSTISDASAFIDEYGLSKYNKRSELNYIHSRRQYARQTGIPIFNSWR